MRTAVDVNRRLVRLIRCYYAACAALAAVSAKPGPCLRFRDAVRRITVAVFDRALRSALHACVNAIHCFGNAQCSANVWWTAGCSSAAVFACWLSCMCALAGLHLIAVLS